LVVARSGEIDDLDEPTVGDDEDDDDDDDGPSSDPDSSESSGSDPNPSTGEFGEGSSERP
jgi:hypothetical protein